MHPLEWDEKKETSMQALYVEVNRRYARKCFQQMAEYGIYPGQIPVLQLLAKKDGRSQKEIAEYLHVKPPTIHMMLQRLEKSEIICRKHDEKDQRISRIYLTEKGKELIASAMDRIRENEKIMFRNFNDTELCLFRRFLMQMLENVDALPEPEEDTSGK